MAAINRVTQPCEILARSRDVSYTPRAKPSVVISQNATRWENRNFVFFSSVLYLCIIHIDHTFIAAGFSIIIEVRPKPAPGFDSGPKLDGIRKISVSRLFSGPTTNNRVWLTRVCFYAELKSHGRVCPQSIVILLGVAYNLIYNYYYFLFLYYSTWIVCAEKIINLHMICTTKKKQKKMVFE